MTQCGFTRSLAIVIGIDRYQSGIPALQSAGNDARSVAALLRDQHGYDLSLLVDEDATLARLTALLNVDLPAQVGPEDRVFFYFAGHGVALNGDDGPEGFILPQDARRNSADSFLSMPALHDALCALKCRHLLAILDCCFAGAFRWSSMRDIVPLPSVLHRERYDRFIRDPAWQVISSAAHDERALDVLLGRALGSRGGSGEHSPFAEVLLEGLSGAGDVVPAGGGDGVITASELYVYLDDALARETADRDHRQTPCLWPLNKHDKGQYIFLAPGHELNLPPAPELTTTNNPYRGLESFGEEHTGLFFGRDRVIRALLPHCVERGLTIVVGASGTGKSSLVKAGLVPALRQRSWEILPIVRPGASPLKALAAALAPLSGLPRESVQTPLIPGEFPALAVHVEAWCASHPDRTLLLVIDQLEELVTMCRDETERDRFLQALIDAIEAQPNRLRVVLTVRSDFEPQFAGGSLEALWRSGRFVVPPMTQDELRDAIEKPASERVLYFEPPALVDELINEVVQMPGALPLLSFTLSEMYIRYLERQANDRALTAADYNALGGVVGALRHRATEEFVMLDPQHQGTMRRVMLRMVSLAGGEIARRRVLRSELMYLDQAENERARRVIDRLSAARLVVEGLEAEGDPYVEPAHDELVRGWDKLWDWIRAERQRQDDLVFQRRLTQAALEWAGAKDEKARNGLLWQDASRSSLLESVLESSDPWFNHAENEFARQSVKRRRRNRLVLVGSITAITIAAVIASVAAVVANNQLHQSESRELASRASRNPETDPVRALVLAIAAARRYPTYEAQEALRSLVQTAHPQAILRHVGVTYTVFTPDGKNVLTIGAGKARVWDVATARQVTTFGAPAASVEAAEFSPDGRRFLTLGGQNIVRLWETATWSQIAVLQDDTADVTFAKFGPDGRRIVTVTEHGRVRLWDGATGQEKTPTTPTPASLWDQQGELSRIVYSSDAHTLLTVGQTVSTKKPWFDAFSARPTARVWDLETGKELRAFRPPTSELVYADLSPDGRLVLTLGLDSTPRLWNVGTGRQVAALEGHQDAIRYASFSPDGRQLVTVSDDQTGRLWDVTTHALLAVLKGHTDAVERASFTRDGGLVATTGQDGTARIWTTRRGQLYTVLQQESVDINHAEFSSDGQWVLTLSRNPGVATLWQLHGEHVTLRAAGVISQAAFSPDAHHLVSTCGNSSACLWEVSGEREVAVLQGHRGHVVYAEFSPDDDIVATAGDDNARLWDAETGRPLAVLGGRESRVLRVAFDPAGRRVVTAGDDSIIRLWEVPSGREIGRLRGQFRTSYCAVFSPDGSLVLATNDDAAARIWDAATGRLVSVLKGHKGLVLDGAFSPDGKLVVTGGSDRTARIWKVADGHQVALLKTTAGNSVSRVAFSSDGRSVLTASGEVRLWNTARPGEGTLLASRARKADVAAFSQDGRRVVTAGWDSTATIWNVGQRGSVPLRGRGRIQDAEFSPDGRTVATAGEEGAARLWDGESGRQIAELRGHAFLLWHVAFSHDGRRIVTTSNDGTARIFCADVRCLIDLAESRVPLNLTEEERQRMVAR